MRDTETRFWSKVDKSDGPDGCWLWTAAVDTNGYGKLSIDGRLVRASRYSFLLANGRWPIAALHHCDNARCVNPSHLFDGTQADNLRDMREKGRHRFVAHSGSANGRAKVTASDVAAICNIYKQGHLTQRAIGGQFGLSNQMVSRIVSGKAWV